MESNSSSRKRRATDQDPEVAAQSSGETYRPVDPIEALTREAYPIMKKLLMTQTDPETLRKCLLFTHPDKCAGTQFEGLMEKLQKDVNLLRERL